MFGRILIEREIADAVHRWRRTWAAPVAIPSTEDGSKSEYAISIAADRTQAREILDLYRRAFERSASAGRMAGPLRPRRHRRYQDIYQPWCFVVLKAEQVVGYALFRPSWTLGLKGPRRRVWLHSVAIDPGARNRGVGTMLLRTTIPVVTHRGRDELLLFVEAQNPAVRVYTSLGFKVVRRVRRGPTRLQLLMRWPPAK